MASRWARLASRYCLIAGVAVAVVDIGDGYGHYRVKPMVTLALDTSVRAGSCAVLRDDTVLVDLAGDPSRSHGERLPVDLMLALERAGVALAEVEVFAVATGPGSFTGLRVGIATMQGLALAAGRPLVGVSVLDALAHTAAAVTNAGWRQVATWVDAWRGEVYASRYEGLAAIDDVTVERPERILSRLHCTTLFIGDGAAVHRETILARLGPLAIVASVPEPLVAGTIGRLAAARVRRGDCPRPHEIEPLYVRRPDAELARQRRVDSLT